MDEIRQDLTVSGDAISGSILDIPAGLRRVFTLNAYDTGGKLTYYGVIEVDMVIGEVVPINIELWRVQEFLPAGTLACKWQSLCSCSNLSDLGGSQSCGRATDLFRTVGHLTTITSAAEQGFFEMPFTLMAWVDRWLAV